MKFLSKESNRFSELRAAGKGILLINERQVIWYVNGKISGPEIIENSFEEFLDSLYDKMDGVSIQRNIVKEDRCAVVVIGSMDQSEEEWTSLYEMFKAVSFPCDHDLVSSILAIPVPKSFSDRSVKVLQTEKHRLVPRLDARVAIASLIAVAAATAMLYAFSDYIVFDRVAEADYDFSQGRFQDALNNYERTLEIDPKNVNALVGVGNTHVFLGNYRTATVYYENALEIDPKNINALGKLGTAYFEAGDYESAALYYNKTLEIDPDNIDALNGQGNILTGQRRYDDALAKYELVLQIHPNDVDAMVGKAKVLTGQGKYSEASTWLDRAIELEPENKELARLRQVLVRNGD